VLGPVLGGLLSGPEGSFTLPCLLAGCMSVLAVIAAGVFLPESHHDSAEQRSEQQQDRRRLWTVLRESQSRLLLLQFVLHTSSVSAITYLFPLWVFALLGWSAREVGIVFGVQGALMALTQGLLMGRLVKLLGELPLLRICVCGFFLGLLLAVFASTAVFMVGAVLIALTGATLCMPVLNSFVSQRTPPRLRGRMMGAASSATAVGRVMGPLLAGLLLSSGGFALAWSLPAAMVFAYALWAFSRWPRRPVPVF